MKTIKFLVDWRGHKAGDIINYAGEGAEDFVRLGYAKFIIDNPKKFISQGFEDIKKELEFFNHTVYWIHIFKPTVDGKQQKGDLYSEFTNSKERVIENASVQIEEIIRTIDESLDIKPEDEYLNYGK